MGCDIHAFLEFDKFKKDNGEWFVHNVAKLHISRDYLLFSILSGTRNYLDKEPISRPKGIPDRVSFRVEGEYTLFVLDEGDNYTESGCCSFEQGQRYAKYKGWWDKERKRVIHPDWHTPSWLNVEELKQAQSIYASTKRETPKTKFLKRGEEMPEGYQPSEVFAWSNTDEVIIIEEIEPGCMGKHKILQGIIGMMEALNEGDVNRTRLVFWYDN